jgi:hypothetical protein
MNAILRSPTLLLPLLLATGCEVDMSRDPAMDPRMPPGIPEEAPASAPTAIQLVNLAEVEGSGISGAARLTPEDTLVRVEITLTGTSAGATHAARIYAGSCEDPGAMIADLEPIRAEIGRTSVERSIEQPPYQVLGGRAVIMIYRANGVVAGPGAACGTIPQQPAAGAENEGGVTEESVHPPPSGS